jgi:pimeloyl-ACP methyl ester carboxylesterase
VGGGPGLGGELDGVPGAAERWGIRQVEVVDLVDGEAVLDGGGEDVDAFGDFGAEVADELGAEQQASAGVAGDPDVDGGGAGVVGLVVVRGGVGGEWLVAGGRGLAVADAGCGGDSVEDADDLGTDDAEELAVSADGVLAGHPALRLANVAIAAGASPKGTLDCTTAFSKTDFRQDLQAFTIPTLVIHGDSDAIVPFEVSGRRTAEAITGSKLVVVPDAPHGLNVTHTDTFNTELLAFLRG